VRVWFFYFPCCLSTDNHVHVHENPVGLKLNATHQLLAYADDVNLLGNTIHTTEILTDDNREVRIKKKCREN
jgi:hypothetical protein